MALLLGTASQVAGAPASSNARNAIARVLRVRSAAVVSRDRRAFMATVAGGSEAFKQRQEALFAAMKDVPLASYELTARWERFGDLTRPVDEEAFPAAQRVAVPVTEERYAIRGFDDPPFEEDLFYTFVERDGKWSIGGDTSLDDLGLKTSRHLWDFGPVTTTNSRHFLLLTHPCSASIGCARLPSDILTTAETALSRVDRFWKEPWRHRIVILAPTTPAELHRMLQATFDVNKFVAFAYSTADIEHGLRFIGRRIILNWNSIAHRTTDSLLTILAHELAHVATRSASGPAMPTFVEEGLAEHVGYDADPSSLSYLDSLVGAGGFDGKLPADYEFTTGTGRDIYLSYQKAESAVRFFIQRWGLQRFDHFYTSLGRQRVEAGTSRFHLDQTLRRTIGTGFLRFQKLWASSLRR